MYWIYIAMVFLRWLRLATGFALQVNSLSCYECVARSTWVSGKAASPEGFPALLSVLKPPVQCVCEHLGWFLKRSALYFQLHMANRPSHYILNMLRKTRARLLTFLLCLCPRTHLRLCFWMTQRRRQADRDGISAPKTNELQLNAATTTRPSSFWFWRTKTSWPNLTLLMTPPEWETTPRKVVLWNNKLFLRFNLRSQHFKWVRTISRWQTADSSDWATNSQPSV